MNNELISKQFFLKISLINIWKYYFEMWREIISLQLVFIIDILLFSSSLSRKITIYLSASRCFYVYHSSVPNILPLLVIIIIISISILITNLAWDTYSFCYFEQLQFTNFVAKFLIKINRTWAVCVLYTSYRFCLS